MQRYPPTHHGESAPRAGTPAQPPPLPRAGEAGRGQGVGRSSESPQVPFLLQLKKLGPGNGRGSSLIRRESVFLKSRSRRLRGCCALGLAVTWQAPDCNPLSRCGRGFRGLRGAGLRWPRRCLCGHGCVGPQPAPAKPGSDLVPSKRASLPQLPCILSRGGVGWSGVEGLLPACLSFFFPAHFQKGPREIQFASLFFDLSPKRVHSVSRQVGYLLALGNGMLALEGFGGETTVLNGRNLKFPRFPAAQNFPASLLLGYLLACSPKPWSFSLLRPIAVPLGSQRFRTHRDFFLMRERFQLSFLSSFFLSLSPLKS